MTKRLVKFIDRWVIGIKPAKPKRPLALTVNWTAHGGEMIGWHMIESTPPRRKT